jgi:hypothetical protein
MRLQTILTAALLTLFALSLRAMLPWVILASTNSAGTNSFLTVGTFTSVSGFVKLQAPNGSTVLAGSIVTHLQCHGHAEQWRWHRDDPAFQQ